MVLFCTSPQHILTSYFLSLQDFDSARVHLLFLRQVKGSFWLFQLSCLVAEWEGWSSSFNTRMGLP